MDKLKIKGFRKVINEKVIDTFESRTFDDKKIYLLITENKKAFMRGFQTIIGWTEDIHLAFNIWNNSVPISTFQELYDNRK